MSAKKEEKNPQRFVAKDKNGEIVLWFWEGKEFKGVPYGYKNMIHLDCSYQFEELIKGTWTPIDGPNWR